MTVKERHEREEKLLTQVREIGESVRDITPKDGHLSLTWFPDGHMDAYIFSGETATDKDGNEIAEMILDAWAETADGNLKVCRI